MYYYLNGIYKWINFNNTLLRTPIIKTSIKIYGMWKLLGKHRESLANGSTLVWVE